MGADGLPQVPLRDVVRRVIGGGTPPRSVAAYWAGDIPWASVKDFSDEMTDLTDTVEHISSSGLHASSSNLIPADIPLVCTRMAVGRCAMTSRDTAINQDVKALEPIPTIIEARYLLHCMKNLQSRLDSIGVGSTVKGVSLKDLLNQAILSLPMPEQRRIAEILDTVDEAIRRTEQVIAKLQQMKQGLLHDLLTRGIDENGELRPPPEEAPHLYKDSPLGLIPRNWDYSELRRTGTWLSGGTPPKNEPRFWGGSIPWVSPKDMKCFLMEDTEDHVTTSGASVGSQRVSPGAVLIVVRGMILAHTFPVCITLREMTFNQDIKALVPRQEISGLFLAYWMVCNKDSLLGIVTEATHGTKRIDMDDLGDLLIALPPKNEVQNILNRLQALDRDLLANNNYLLKLRSVKSGLMHDLLTGRIRVPTDSVCVEVNPTEVA